jgi:hypothetical protein
MLALALLLLPLVPTWAQPDLKRISVERTDIDNAKVELQRAGAEMEQLQKDLMRIRDAFNDAKKKLVLAEAKLKVAEEAKKLDLKPDGDPLLAHGGLEKRLAALENNLAGVLREVQGLRNSFGKGTSGDEFGGKVGIGGHSGKGGSVSQDKMPKMPAVNAPRW